MGEQLVPCWLVWAISNRGITSLQAVASTPEKARMYRDMAKREPGNVWAQIEARQLDHFFGSTGYAPRLSAEEAERRARVERDDMQSVVYQDDE